MTQPMMAENGVTFKELEKNIYSWVCEGCGILYIPDETLELEKMGLISTNMEEFLVKGISKLSYRKCAAKVSEMTGNDGKLYVERDGETNEA